MKIAYFVHLNMGPKSGVYKKILTQIDAWQELGNVARLFVVTKNKDVSSALNEIKKDNIEIFNYGKKVKGKYFDERILIFSQAGKHVIEWKPDIVYTRQDLYYPPLKRLYEVCRVVIEVNTNDNNEIWIENKIKWFYNKLTRNILFKRAAGLVFVSKEISNSPSYIKFKKPSIVISNSIDLSKFKSAPEKNPSDDIRFVFIGNNNCPWHGVDKIIFLAKKKKDWNFELIGVFPNDSKPSNVNYHGQKSRDAYESLIYRADVGIGTLALHRIKMNETSSLKIREYLAYGLPVIIGCKDTDFPNGADFILELPNTEKNVENSISLIQQFITKWKGKHVPRSEISHLDVKYKEENRIEFLKSIIK